MQTILGLKLSAQSGGGKNICVWNLKVSYTADCQYECTSLSVRECAMSTMMLY
jgi:hypothetical protein